MSVLCSVDERKIHNTHYASLFPARFAKYAAVLHVNSFQIGELLSTREAAFSGLSSSCTNPPIKLHLLRSGTIALLTNKISNDSPLNPKMTQSTASKVRGTFL